MKITFNLVLVAFCVGALIYAEDTPTGGDATDSEVLDESASKGGTDADELSGCRARCQSLKRKMDELEQRYKTMESPPQSLSRIYDRVSKVLDERMQSVEKLSVEQQKLVEERAAKLGSEFVFSIVPQDQRMKYVEDGKRVLKDATRILHGSTDAQQVDGINLFMKAREAYQGIEDYAKTKQSAAEALAKLSKKWNHIKNKLSKAREKLNAVALQKAEQMDARGMEKMEHSMEAAGKDIDRQLFVPVPNNLLMMDKACTTALMVSKSFDREQADKQGATEKILTAFWEKVDMICSEMQKGRLAEAESLLNSRSGELSDALNLQVPYMDQTERDKLNEQIQALRADLRERVRFASKNDSLITRNTRTIESTLNSMEQQLERLEMEFDSHNPTQEDEDQSKDSKVSDKDVVVSDEQVEPDDDDPDGEEDETEDSREEEEDTDEEDEEE